jgi:hypothetical protein
MSLGVPPLPEGELEGGAGKIGILKAWLRRNGASGADSDKAIQEIKEVVFNDLRQSQIKIEYYQYLVHLLAVVADL